MATNEFYNTSNRSERRRSDAPLPPLPVPTSSFSAYRSGQASRLDSPISPIEHPSSPVYRDYSQQSLESSTAYYGAGGGKTDEQGPYADNIPLRSQKNSADELPRSEQPRRVDSQPQEGIGRRRRRSRQEKEGGIFGGKVPWVVYILTLAQITVFIAELVRSCKKFPTPLIPGN